MSQSQSIEVDVQFFLPKEGSSTTHLPQEDPSEITKTIGIHIEDFLERLNSGLRNEEGVFISSPESAIGYGSANIWLAVFSEDDIIIGVQVLCSGNGNGQRDPEPKSLSVRGICGNLSFEKSEAHWCVEIGSIEELTEAMTSSGNHKLDFQCTATVSLAEMDADDREWIIPK